MKNVSCVIPTMTILKRQKCEHKNTSIFARKLVDVKRWTRTLEMFHSTEIISYNIIKVYLSHYEFINTHWIYSIKNNLQGLQGRYSWGGQHQHPMLELLHFLTAPLPLQLPLNGLGKQPKVTLVFWSLVQPSKNEPKDGRFFFLSHLLLLFITLNFKE